MGGIKIRFFLVSCLICFFVLHFIDAEMIVGDDHRMNLTEVASRNTELKGSCTSREDCNFRGTCRGNIGERYCDCFQGTSGRNCEIIDECVNNTSLCGKDPEASCEFHLKKKRAICRCQTFRKRFDIPTKTCVDRRPCQRYRQCFNGAECINENNDENQPHYCECKFGTSGDFCERVEECIDNPNYCGDGDDVECRYNTYIQRAYCQCQNQNQRFDWPQKRCVDRNKCRRNEDCLPFGVCHNRCTRWEPCLDHEHIEEKRSCHCIEGTSGENCEVIDDCYNKVVDCGTSDNVTCDYNYNHGFLANTFCRCKDRSLEFDPHDKQCKVCDCGDGATSCLFKNGEKTCICDNASYNHGDRCEECKCGEESEGCTFTNGEKVCICNPGYKSDGGVCELE